MSGLAARNDPPGEPPDLLALPPGARVLEFEIERVVGRGGFSIVYLAFDHSLHRRVALKEYLPDTLARRDATLTVVPFSAKHRETFDVGLRSFVEEARLLARFDHPSLVKVYRFWEASGTAYMAMSYYEGSTLREAFRLGPPPEPSVVEAMTVKLLEAVEILHRGQCLHRDIAPDNVILQRNGIPVLLDFGAARRIIREKTQALTVILKTGFAPIEQYSEEGEMEQGPWTDVYALAATLYAVITGKGPPACVSRAYTDPYVPLARIAPQGYSPPFTTAIDQALSFLPDKRPQTIAAFREALGVRDRPAPPKRSEAVAPPKRTEVAAPPPPPRDVEAPRVPVATPEPDLQPVRVPLPAEDAQTVLVPQAAKRRALPRSLYVAIALGALAVIATAVLYLPGHDIPAPPAETKVAVRVPTPAPLPEPTPAPSPAAPAPGQLPPSLTTAPVPPVVVTPVPAAPPRERPQPERNEAAQPKAVPSEPVAKPSPPPTAAPRAAERKGPASSPIPVPGPITPPASPPPPVTAPEPPTVVAKADPTPRESADPAEALRALRKSAGEGDARAQNMLGFAYYTGNGVGVDLAAARKWYEASAAQGHAPAQNNLGNLYLGGIGDGRNYVLAVAWYRKAADQGYGLAQNNLGILIRDGKGAARDPAAAAELFRRAADGGNMNAMFNLARLYETGTGVPKSRDDALKWFHAAADKGQKSAIAKLAELEGK